MYCQQIGAAAKVREFISVCTAALQRTRIAFPAVLPFQRVLKSLLFALLSGARSQILVLTRIPTVRTMDSLC